MFSDARADTAWLMTSAREMERVKFSEDVPSSYHVPGPVLGAWGGAECNSLSTIQSSWGNDDETL